MKKNSGFYDSVVVSEVILDDEDPGSAYVDVMVVREEDELWQSETDIKCIATLTGYKDDSGEVIVSRSYHGSADWIQSDKTLKEAYETAANKIYDYFKEI